METTAGRVSDGLGRKRPLLAGLAAFTVLSVACAAAPNIGALCAAALPCVLLIPGRSGQA